MDWDSVCVDTVVVSSPGIQSIAETVDADGGWGGKESNRQQDAVEQLYNNCPWRGQLMPFIYRQELTVAKNLQTLQEGTHWEKSRKPSTGGP